MILLRITIFCISFCFFDFARSMELNNLDEGYFRFLSQQNDEIKCPQEQPSHEAIASFVEQSASVDQDDCACPYCNKIYSSPSNCDRHIKRCHLKNGIISKKILIVEKNVPCTRCDKKFAETKDLELHIDRAHMPYAARPLGCSLCGMRFLKKSELEKHANMPHDKLVILYCKYCPFRTLKESALSTHARNQHLLNVINNLS
jgi:uncharacterized C2H2 Zn-finger protein